MKRGDIVIAAERGDYAGKPRPYVVVQSTMAVDGAAAITLCPLTSRLTGMNLFRVAVPPVHGTGLIVSSEIQVDRITTIRRTRVRDVIGTLPNECLKQVDAALRRWLAL